MFALLLASTAAVAPRQTSVQKSVADKHHTIAATASNAAKSKVLAVLDSSQFRSEISALGNLSKTASAELLEMMYQEISLAGMSHTIADNRLSGVSGHGYVTNWWEGVCEGDIPYDKNYAVPYQRIEVTGMGYPPLNLPPTKPGCYDRELYLGHNVWKQSGGQLWAGPVGLFVDMINATNATFISPVDTGCFYGTCGLHLEEGEKEEEFWEGRPFSTTTRITAGKDDPNGPQIVCMVYSQLSTRESCGAWDGKTYGTLHHFWHTILSHLGFFNLKMSQLFLRWYGKGYPIPSELRELTYMEGELSAAFLIPDLLLLVVGKYSELFGNARGRNVQTWTYNNHRPMAWAYDNTGGTIIDAHVGKLDGEYHITTSDQNAFDSAWSHNPSWANFRDNTNPHLQLHILGAHNHQSCDKLKCSSCRPVGVNKELECLYWKK